ncbi:UDP-N-acetylglucosamine--N-acetylmuramyl-(pentapeptide) pyrophosphoryl-undecaprenol N-acetylglucosamine transferase [Limihaloglobus sulfuriphilus]|uniref:UDP-N-acetylglucosamine--N-acetylmuramyl-(pentapeptide) pyrophosphoryl-undecaprenol N-acetylglucosamine transferase n=1 Tax=Limihaloglobus sulfuriphilus TaxID=1851148 RepID=A0A1Q2MAW6_9BACT|nr:UDP-N-acetylglucosamine--N-acetylmuramyl-(pentapeptide) pyrophosphoryl-undecaprenol N-acetylglucosamine transferase [Limihaloglobus sulfuriphilus]AQQ69814.1 UDP-N-acetylglucosamine--N-acetylmuramyl-(pentapeptide) pyrophosphoryl-undecaprenol N-acetylglucosamine transferase [Limihaloglobus sulfuriphilus]
MTKNNGKIQVFFAGGGTGGHIYPAIAAAQKIRKLAPETVIHFLCSQSPIDANILSKTEFEYTALPARGFALHPVKILNFILNQRKSRNIVSQVLTEKSVIVGIGGYVSAPAVAAAKKKSLPVCLINVDYVPGKSNRLMASKTDKIFCQYQATAGMFTNTNAKIFVTGCPMREEFETPRPEKIISEYNLSPDKSTLLVTGASSGALNINIAMETLLPRLESFADNWQVLHLSGRGKDTRLKDAAAKARIEYRVVDYCDNIWDMYSCADIVIGRAGAVSIAEYTYYRKPFICLPYPYHKDNHQQLNAIELEKAGACLIVEDMKEDRNATAENIWQKLEPLLSNKGIREQMSEKTAGIAKKDAAETIASEILKLA